MRTFVTLFVTVLSLSLFLQCNEKEETNCDDVLAVYNAAFVDVCTGRTDCLLCDCWAAGQTIDGTECGAVVSCDASDLVVCASDETACAFNIKMMVETVCGTNI